MRFNEDDVRKIQQMYCADVQDLHLGQQAVMLLSGAWLEQDRLILEHAQEALKNAGLQQINALHHRGSLSDTIKEFENGSDFIFIGKRGRKPTLNLNF